MVRPRSFLILAASLLVGGATPLISACESSPTGGAGCCRVCKEGKACGDSCIARDKTCNVGPGCACNG
jgi:hypothetical protein